MVRLIIIAVIAWVVGVIGWSQIIGSLQNLGTRKGLLFTMLLWVVIMAAGAYVAVKMFSGTVPLIIGYVISYLQVKASGRIS